ERALAASRRALGSGRLHAKSRVAVAATDSDDAEDLYEEALVERAANGDLHARYENSRDQAREIVSSGGLLWLRPGFGRYHRPGAAGAPRGHRQAVTRALQRSTAHLSASRRLIAAHAAATALGGLVPIPFLDDQLPALVKRAMIKRIATARNIDIDDDAVRILA